MYISGGAGVGALHGATPPPPPVRGSTFLHFLRVKSRELYTPCGCPYIIGGGGSPLWAIDPCNNQMHGRPQGGKNVIIMQNNVAKFENDCFEKLPL